MAVIDSGFERDFQLEVQRSELSRSRIFAFALGFLVIVQLVIVLNIPDTQKPTDVSLKALYQTGIGIAIVLLAVEFFYSRWLEGRQKRMELAPAISAYTVSLLELCGPVGILVAFTVLFPADTISLQGPGTSFILLITLSPLRLDARQCILTGLVAGTSYAVWALHTLTAHKGIYWPVIAEEVILVIFHATLLYISGGLATFVAIQNRRTLWNAVNSTLERNRITRIFGQHVAPQVAEQLLKHQNNETPQQRHVCILVLDIRNFTTYSESASPHEVMNTLSVLWEKIVAIVGRHDGIVNKFLGDGLMAVFGAPVESAKAEREALECAREIIREVQTLKSTGQIPDIGVGIGIHSGNTLIGTVGSEARKEYTVIGDVVNVAFRIESLNKELGTLILFSEQVRERANPSGDQIKDCGEHSVKGRAEKVHIYSLEPPTVAHPAP